MADTAPPWTIKNFPLETRNAATQAASRAGLTIGQWLDRAVRAQVQLEMNEQRMPAVVQPTQTPAPMPPALRLLNPQEPRPVDALNLDTLAKVMHVAGLATENGKPARSIARRVNTILRDTLDASYPAAPRPPKNTEAP